MKSIIKFALFFLPFYAASQTKESSRADSGVTNISADPGHEPAGLAPPHANWSAANFLFTHKLDNGRLNFQSFSKYRSSSRNILRFMGPFDGTPPISPLSVYKPFIPSKSYNTFMDLLDFASGFYFIEMENNQGDLIYTRIH